MALLCEMQYDGCILVRRVRCDVCERVAWQTKRLWRDDEVGDLAVALQLPDVRLAFDADFIEPFAAADDPGSLAVAAFAKGLCEDVA